MSGRNALLLGNPEAALPHFQSIAQANPNFINCAEQFCIGIWTFLGRTYHELGNNQQALESLKRGRGLHRVDRFNQIYLGLVMAKAGQTTEGAAELEAGLKVLGTWLSGFAGRGTTGRYWDPGRRLQRAIADTRALLQPDRIDWDRVNRDVHSLALNFEQEVRDVQSQRQDSPRMRRF
jgi:tetratricopeptide (TPR) repeat protein